jgi:hypothetical protein
MAIIENQAFSVDPNGARQPANSAIAMNQKGDFVIAWQANDNDSSGIYARTFNPSGEAKTDTFLVNDNQIGAQFSASVSINIEGDFIIAWTGPLQGSSGSAIYGKRYNYFGTVTGREFNLYGPPAGQYSPSVALHNNGNVSAAWSWNVRANDIDILMGHFGTNNRPLRSIELVDPYYATRGEQYSSQIVTNSNGNTVVVWDGFGKHDDMGIYAQRINENGVPQGSVISVNERIDDEQFNPTVAIAQDGSFIVAWEGDGIDGNGLGIAARRFDALGNPLGSEFQVNTSTVGDQGAPAIAMGDHGNFVVAWSSRDRETLSTDVVARYYNSNGRPASREIMVGDVGENRYSPDVAMNGFGDFTVTWHGERSGSKGIQAQQFTLASTIAFDKRNIKVKEGKNAVLTLSRSDETHLRSRVTVDVIGGTATRGEDYRFNKPINVTFKPGQTEKSIRIPILKDNLIEKKETILLEIEEKDRAYLDKGTKAKITILDVPPKGRGRSMDVLLGDEQIAVGKSALKMEQVRSGGSRQPLFASAERQPIFGQSFDINPFAGKGSVSLGNEVPETPSLFTPSPTTETPFALAASAI